MDRCKLGRKRHIVVDVQGIPLMALASGANRRDCIMFEKCIDALPTVKGLRGRPRRRPAKRHADEGYDFARCTEHLRSHGISSRLAKRGIGGSKRLDKHRWLVERAHAWFADFGKLRIRFKRRLDIHTALFVLAAAIICSRFVGRPC